MKQYIVRNVAAHEADDGNLDSTTYRMQSRKASLPSTVAHTCRPTLLLAFVHTERRIRLVFSTPSFHVGKSASPPIGPDDRRKAVRPAQWSPQRMSTGFSWLKGKSRRRPAPNHAFWVRRSVHNTEDEVFPRLPPTVSWSKTFPRKVCNNCTRIA